jgi:ABC-type nitrate/sulfonate/bicarbonate transport system permease component
VGTDEDDIMAQRQISAVGPRSVPRPRLWELVRHRKLAPVLAIVLFLITWQVVTPLLPTALIPMPIDVFRFMWDEIRGDTLARTNVWQAFAISLRRLGLGFAIAFVVGVPVGVLMGASRWIERLLRDLVLVGLAMPYLVWALLTASWFGLDSNAMILTVVLAAVPFVIINTVEGVRDVPRELSDMARSFRVPRGDVIRHVILPSLMPFFFASLRYGLANGWKGLVVAEIFAATSGAGWNLQFWYDAHRAYAVVGYALFFVLFALFIEQVVFQKLSQHVFRWRPAGDVTGPAARRKQLQDV